MLFIYTIRQLFLFLESENYQLTIPESLLQELHGIKGFDRVKFVAAHATAAPVSVRIHPVKGNGIFMTNDRVLWHENGVYLPERPVFTLDPAYHTGAYYVQEASSMYLGRMLQHVLAGRENLRILDLCAAPGGKSTLIASAMTDSSLLIANEVIRTRASILEENISRWGYMNTWVTSNDPRDLGKLTGYFDVIVVDAPCSGSGLWRKDANALNEWSEANVTLCHQRQQRILADVWPALKENGVLIYATCSYSPQEDEDVLDWLAATYSTKGLTIPPEEHWGITEITSPKHQMPGYRFYPGNVKGEGFFIAAVQKKESAGSLKPLRFKTANNPKIQAAAAHLLQRDDIVLIAGKDNCYNAVNMLHEADIALLQQAVYLRKTGLEAGTPMSKEWIPSHDVALCIDISKQLPAIDADREQALRYLKREETGIDNIPKGWHVVRYNGQGLGWIKGLGNRTNNYLPKQWRIRMDIDA